MLFPEKQQYSLDELLQIYGLTWNDIPDIRKSYPMKELKPIIEEFKTVIKIRYRQLAIKHHPDQGGNPQNFRVINRLYQSVMKEMKIIPRQQPMQVRIIRTSNGYWGNTYTSTTNIYT